MLFQIMKVFLYLRKMKNIMDLRGKTAMVCGSTQGIGKATAIQMAELELKKQAQSMNLDFAKLNVEDRKSARDMQIATKSYIPSALAVGVTLGFFGILGGLMYGKIEHAPQIDIMLGSLGTAWTGIIAFYFGSSAGSQAKDKLLHQSEPTK
jgi:hypothetical protein